MHADLAVEQIRLSWANIQRGAGVYVTTLWLCGCADASSTLAKRLNREVETDAIESLTLQWLQLLPLLIEACAQLPHPSAFLYDVFQVSVPCILADMLLHIM